MLLPSAHSRRALVASATALAAAPVVTAKKGKGKKKKKKSVPPLAFAVAMVTDLGFPINVSTFSCSVSWGWIYPAGPLIASLATDIDVTFAAAEEQIRAEIVAKVREFVASDLAANGVEVPVERIAITLL